MAAERGDLDSDPILHALLPEVFPPGPGDHCHADRVGAGIEAHRSFADEHDRTDVALFEVIAAKGLQGGFLDLLRHGHQLFGSLGGGRQEFLNVPMTFGTSIGHSL